MNNRTLSDQNNSGLFEKYIIASKREKNNKYCFL